MITCLITFLQLGGYTSDKEEILLLVLLINVVLRIGNKNNSDIPHFLLGCENFANSKFETK